MNMRVCFGLCAGVVLSAVVFAADPATTAPESQPVPRDANVIQNGKQIVRFAVWQGGKQVVADKNTVVHLKREAFEFRFTGDVSNVALLTSHSPDISKALDQAKAPVITLSGMGGAHDDGDLLVEDAPDDVSKLWTWVDFAKEYFGQDETARSAKTLHEKYQDLPMVLEAAEQFVDIAPDDTQLTVAVKKLFKSDFATDKGLYVVVMVTDPVDKELFLSLKWKTIRILFDG